MAFRRRTIWTRAAIGVVLTISMLSTADAQAPRAGRGPRPPYTPAAGAKDLRAVLFNWTWYMGMLRSTEEHELVASLEYQGKGAIQVDGQPMHAHEVSCKHQLPDAGSADSVYRSTRVRAEPRHAGAGRCRNRRENVRLMGVGELFQGGRRSAQ